MVAMVSRLLMSVTLQSLCLGRSCPCYRESGREPSLAWWKSMRATWTGKLVLPTVQDGSRAEGFSESSISVFILRKRMVAVTALEAASYTSSSRAVYLPAVGRAAANEGNDATPKAAVPGRGQGVARWAANQMRRRCCCKKDPAGLLSFIGLVSAWELAVRQAGSPENTALLGLSSPSMPVTPMSRAT